jgi:hypothetical protein
MMVKYSFMNHATLRLAVKYSFMNHATLRLAVKYSFMNHATSRLAVKYSFMNHATLRLAAEWDAPKSHLQLLSIPLDPTLSQYGCESFGYGCRILQLLSAMKL